MMPSMVLRLWPLFCAFGASALMSIACTLKGGKRRQLKEGTAVVDLPQSW